MNLCRTCGQRPAEHMEVVGYLVDPENPQPHPALPPPPSGPTLCHACSRAKFPVELQPYIFGERPWPAEWQARREAPNPPPQDDVAG